MTHDLKCFPGPFQAIWDGKKKHEIRVNDRPYRVGDQLLLREYDPLTTSFSGRKIEVGVTYITQGGKWGLPGNLCVMSIEV